METKDLLGLTLIPLALLLGIGVTAVSQRARDAAFFVLVAGTALTEKLDINFVSRYWYRGTTRGFEFTFIDVLAISLLVSTLLLPRPGQERWYWPASLGALILYCVYCCISVSFSEPKLYGLFELSKILRGIVVFLAAALFVRTERELGILVLALGLTICFEGALALKQRYLSGVYRVTGSLDHPNSLSMYLCMAGPLFVAAATANFPRYLRYFSMLCIWVAGLSILLTISRAGIPIFGLVMLGATVFCVSWRITIRKSLATLAVGLGVAGMVYKSWDNLQARFSGATFEQEYVDENLEGRGYYLRLARAIVEDRFFGVGLNNWSYWVSKSYGAQLGFPYEDYDDIEYAPSKEILPSIMYAAPAHNLGALTAGELGWPGLVLFALVWLRWLQMGASFLWKRSPEVMPRLGVGLFFAVGGVGLQSLFEWVYRQTQIYLAFHVLLGTLASLYVLRRKRKPAPVEARPTIEAPLARFETAGAREQ